MWCPRVKSLPAIVAGHRSKFSRNFFVKASKMLVRDSEARSLKTLGKQLLPSQSIDTTFASTTLVL